MSITQIIADPGIPQIQITREFSATRELLFRAHTEPQLLARWLGPRRLTMAIDQYSVRHGGTWRFIHRDAEGNEYGFRGVFHGTPSVDDGIVQTWEFEGAPGHIQLQTATFEDRGGKTLLRVNAVYQSVEARDAELASGMEGGMNEGYERLDELLTALPVART